MIGFIKVILIIWIAATVYRWYQKYVSSRRERKRTVEYSAASNPRIPHSGRIEDADFEEMDGNKGKGR